MNHALIPRSAWTTTVRPAARLAPLVASEVRGLAIHYTGSATPLGQTATLEQSARRLEAERVDHVTGRGWTDIAYAAAADQAGNLFDCRGARWRSAANGDRAVNGSHGAITWLGGVGDEPTAAAVAAIRWWREHEWLPLFPHATAVVGHRDLHSTACPGDPMYGLILAGAFTRTLSPTEDDMPLTNDEIDAVARRVWSWPFPAPTSADRDHTESSGERLVWASRQSAVAPTLDSILGAVRALSDPDKFAAAVAERLPAAGGGVDPAVLARAVRAELAAALHG